MVVLVKNVSEDFIYFKSPYGVAHILAPGGEIELRPADYKAAAISRPKEAEVDSDAYPESAISSRTHDKVAITNVGRKTLVFTPVPVKLPNVIIKSGETEALYYVHYHVSAKLESE